MCRAHTKMGVRVLVNLIRDDETPPAAKVAAIALLFQRGWGNPTNEDGSTPGERIIVEIVQGGGSINVVQQIDVQPEPELELLEPHERNGK
jgi:hypothetical protein